MYAVVNSLKLASSIAPDVWDKAQQELPPLMRAISGFEEFQVIEVSADQVILVIVADTAETLDRIASEVGNSWMRDNVLPYLDGAPDRKIGKVVVSWVSPQR